MHLTCTCPVCYFEIDVELWSPGSIEKCPACYYALNVEETDQGDKYLLEAI